MVKMLLTWLLLFLGIAQIVPCSVFAPCAFENYDRVIGGNAGIRGDTLASENFSEKDEFPAPQSCDACSGFCYHAVTFINVNFMFRFQSNADSELNALVTASRLSWVHLDSLKRPPRFSS